MLQRIIATQRLTECIFQLRDGVLEAINHKVQLKSGPVTVNDKLSKRRSLAAIVGFSAVLWLAMLEIGKVAVSHL